MSRYWTVWSTALLFFGGFYALLVTIPLHLEAVGLLDWQIGFALGALGVSFGALFAFLPYWQSGGSWRLWGLPTACKGSQSLPPEF